MEREGGRHLARDHGRSNTPAQGQAHLLPLASKTEFNKYSPNLICALFFFLHFVFNKPDPVEAAKGGVCIVATRLPWQVCPKPGTMGLHRVLPAFTLLLTMILHAEDLLTVTGQLCL